MELDPIDRVVRRLKVSHFAPVSEVEYTNQAVLATCTSGMADSSTAGRQHLLDQRLDSTHDMCVGLRSYILCYDMPIAHDQELGFRVLG